MPNQYIKQKISKRNKDKIDFFSSVHEELYLKHQTTTLEFQISMPFLIICNGKQETARMKVFYFISSNNHICDYCIIRSFSGKFIGVRNTPKFIQNFISFKWNLTENPITVLAPSIGVMTIGFATSDNGEPISVIYKNKQLSLKKFLHLDQVYSEDRCKKINEYNEEGGEKPA